MITLTPDAAAAALGVERVWAPVTGVSTDTRTINPGDVFVALRGESYDGYQFVPAAFAAGAAAAVVELGAAIAGDVEYVPPGGGRLYRVPDPRASLGALARAVRRASSASVVAITGSVGKTSTKDLVRAMAATHGAVVATAANQNNEIGVPLTLLEVSETTDTVVVEMGMRGKGQIRELTLIAEPDVAVITAIAPVHLELVGTIEDVIEAKCEVFEGLRPGGAAVVPVDSPPVVAAAEAAGVRVVRFAFVDTRRMGTHLSRAGAGGEEGAASGPLAAEVRGIVAAGPEGPVLRVEWPGGEVEIAAPFRAAHRLRNATASAAACFAAGFDVETCLRGIGDVAFTPMRGDETYVGGVLLVDDTYNANPAAVRLALEDLAATASASGARSVAVLGDMLELGVDTTHFHREVGTVAAQVGVRRLWGIGPRSKATVEAFAKEAEVMVEGEGGVDGETGDPTRAERPKGNGVRQPAAPPGAVGAAFGGADVRAAHWAEQPEDAVEELLADLCPGDVVLVKGSRGMRLDRLVEQLTARLAAAAGRAGDRRP